MEEANQRSDMLKLSSKTATTKRGPPRNSGNGLFSDWRDALRRVRGSFPIGSFVKGSHEEQRMDSKEVNKQIRAVVHPVLKAQGFSKFTARDSWRFHDDRIDVVNFQSFNTYHAEGIGCTTYSFAVNIGCFFTYIPEQYPLTRKDGLILPQECECHFRGRLHKTIKQWKLKNPNIWFIDTKGENLSDAMNDVKERIEEDCPAWFIRLADRQEVLRILREDSEGMGELWGFGKNPSPIRSYMLGYVALSLGKAELANHHLALAAESGCFKKLFSNAEEAKRRMLKQDGTSVCR